MRLDFNKKNAPDDGKFTLLLVLLVFTTGSFTNDKVLLQLDIKDMAHVFHTINTVLYISAVQW